MGKLIYGNKTTGVEKVATGKYKFKVRYGSNKRNEWDFGLYDRRKTVKATTDAEAKKDFKKWQFEQERAYRVAKERHEERQMVAETQFLRDDADKRLLKMTFVAFTAEDGMFWDNIPLNRSGDEYSTNAINMLRRTVNVVNNEDYMAFNRKELALIDRQDAEELLTKLRQRKKLVNKAEKRYEPISNATLSSYVLNLRIIFDALESTFKLRKAGTNPFSDLKVGKIRYKQEGKTSLDTSTEYKVVKEEVKKLLQPRPPKKAVDSKGRRAPARPAQPHQALMYLFAMISMLRRGEASALRWHDFNYEDKTVNIKGVFESPDGSTRPQYRKFTKSHEVRMSILSNELIDILKELEPKNKQYWTDERGNKHDLVFLNDAGEPYRLDYWTHAWVKFRDELRDNGIIKNATTLHDLRGSGISYYLIERKLDVVTIAKIVGHSDVAMTLNVYANATDNNIRQLAKDIDL